MDSTERYSEVADRLALTDDVQRGAMFGMPCLKAGSKAFAGLYEGELVAKLTGEAHARALALEGARLFEPMAGRPMREWVLVPVAHAGTWEELARSALAYVRPG